MTPEQYLELAVQTESNPQQAANRMGNSLLLARLIHAGMGLTTETGEFQDILKRAIFYGKELDFEAAVHLQEEIGDVLWYLAVAVDALNTWLEDVAPEKRKSLTEIMEQNIRKLRTRYPFLFSEEAAVNRNLAQEKRALDQ